MNAGIFSSFPSAVFPDRVPLEITLQPRYIGIVINVKIITQFEMDPVNVVIRGQPERKTGGKQGMQADGLGMEIHVRV